MFIQSEDNESLTGVETEMHQPSIDLMDNIQSGYDVPCQTERNDENDLGNILLNASIG